MFHLFSSESTFFQKLLKFDYDKITELKAKGCPHCSGKLDQANFRRKPRCPFGDLPEDFHLRFSLCCRRQGCRKRCTPPSPRFFGRRVYWSLAMLLISAQLLCHGPDTRTQMRWHHWWNQGFKQSTSYKAIRSYFFSSVQGTGSEYPYRLLEQSRHSSESILNLLAMLAPCFSHSPMVVSAQ